MTGWCVEYWRVPKRYGGSHAQMSEQLKYTRPEQEDIQRRYFDRYESATRFANSLFDTGTYFTQVMKG